MRVEAWGEQIISIFLFLIWVILFIWDNMQMQTSFAAQMYKRFLLISIRMDMINSYTILERVPN